MSTDAMDYFSFAEPASISARQFLTQQYSVASTEGIDYVYQPNMSARVEIAGQSQNSFILPRTFRLCYSAVAQVKTLPDSTGVPLRINCLLFEGPHGVDQAPGAFIYGAPQLGSVLCEVPGLSSDFSYLTSDTQSQKHYTQRLLCSGDEGGCELSGLKRTFKQTGRSWEAGGKSATQRGNAVTGSWWRNLFGSASPEAAREYQLGSWTNYQIPGSAFCSLMDGSSSVFPLSYLTSSSSNLNVRVNWAPFASAMVVSQQTRTADAYNYLVSGVSLQWTAVNIISAPILASIESLFRGTVSMPVGGLSIPVPMTLSHRAYRLASTTLTAGSGSVNMRIPAGQACCTAVMLKIDAVQPGVVSSNKHLLSIKPILRNLTLQVGSATFPARPISDIYYGAGVIPRGLSTAKYGTVVTTEADAANLIIGGPTFIPTSEHIAAEMYRECRGNFSFWDDDKYDCSPAAELFAGPTGPSDLTSKTSSRLVVEPTQTVARYAHADIGVTDGQNGSSESPNMFIFPLSAFLPESSLRSRGFQMSGVDLRNQSDIILSFEILGTAPIGVNLINAGDINWPEAGSWDISATMAYTELVTLLPSRVNLQAASSLLPSAAGSVASGGGAAGI